MSRPAIGICAAVEEASWGAWTVLANVSPRSYSAAVHAAGGLALLLPPDDGVAEQPAELLDRIDGLMLAGGSDVDPTSYGARPHPETRGARPERDRFELALAHGALERDMPVLGICRGMEMVNVACGGTLVQHLPDELGSELPPPHPGRLQRPQRAHRGGHAGRAGRGERADGRSSPTTTRAWASSARTWP